MFNGLCLFNRLSAAPFSCGSWNNALAIESVEAQRAELAELQKRDVYDSAAMDALNANAEGGENRLNKTELFTIFYPNLLVPLERSDELIVGGKHPMLHTCFAVVETLEDAVK